MKRILVATLALIAWTSGGVLPCPAQDMNDLNLQLHGYATQGFVYSTNNNWNTIDSSDGSAAWTEAIVNVTAQPQSKLSVGIQARYFLMGSYGNNIALDWAQADYKVNEKFGFRVGKVKTPLGLLNDTRDIDPAQLWSLLPQSVYPVASRGAALAHYGAVAYGTLPLGKSLGKVEYKAYGGQRVVAGDDGYLQQFSDQGVLVPSGVSGRLFGGMLRWDTPVRGLMVGASEDSEAFTGGLLAGPYPGTLNVPRFYQLFYFARYERNKLMLAGEYNRLPVKSYIQFPFAPLLRDPRDNRAFYAMASYKLSEKLTAGAYYASSLDQQLPVSSARFQKDWTLSGRYDFGPYLYLKAEEHFMDGTQNGYSTSDNTAGLKPGTRMTLLKLGVTF